jgi:hypothetical protein
MESCDKMHRANKILKLNFAWNLGLCYIPAILLYLSIHLFWQVSSINQLAELYTVVFRVKLTL